MERKIKRRKKVCPHCGRKLWLREFRPMKDGTRQGWCNECMAAYKREVYARTRKQEDGTFLSKRWQRVVVKNGSSIRFHWSESQLSIIRRHFPNTPTREVAGMLGVSTRTVERIAYRLGLKKEREYIRRCSLDALTIGNLTNPKMRKQK